MEKYNIIMDIVSLGFVVIGGFFVFSLLKAIWQLITTEWKDGEFSALKVLGVFKWTILSLILLILFIAFVVPHPTN
jgi:hypothetical protein